MPSFGPPPGCTCPNYFEMNGVPQHEDDCPSQQEFDEGYEEWLDEQDRLHAEELLEDFDDDPCTSLLYDDRMEASKDKERMRWRRQNKTSETG